MKTPEEIKKGLECCSNATVESCGECPYHTKEDYSAVCIVHLTKDAKVLLAQAERERDALILNHIPQTCDTCKYSLCFSFDNPCNTCNHLYRFNAVERGDTDRWEFIGVRAENTKEDTKE